LRVRSSEGPRQRREVRRTQAAVVCDVEPKRRGTGRDPRRRKEVAESAVRCVDAGAAAGRVRLEVRGGMGPGGVEAGVRPRGGAREPELQESGEEPEHSPGGRPQSAHSVAPAARRSAIAPTSTTPYMHTISGPVGRSPASESHSPRIEASAPEPQAM